MNDLFRAAKALADKLPTDPLALAGYYALAELTELRKQIDIIENPPPPKYIPRMDIYSRPGTVVVFDNQGGYDSEKRMAFAAGLKIGGEYEISRIEVGNSHTSVQLKGLPGEWFNSVQFAAKAAS